MLGDSVLKWWCWLLQDLKVGVEQGVSQFRNSIKSLPLHLIASKDLAR